MDVQYITLLNTCKYLCFVKLHLYVLLAHISSFLAKFSFELVPQIAYDQIWPQPIPG